MTICRSFSIRPSGPLPRPRIDFNFLGLADTGILSLFIPIYIIHRWKQWPSAYCVLHCQKCINRILSENWYTLTPDDLQFTVTDLVVMSYFTAHMLIIEWKNWCTLWSAPCKLSTGHLNLNKVSIDTLERYRDLTTQRVFSSNDVRCRIDVLIKLTAHASLHCRWTISMEGSIWLVGKAGIGLHWSTSYVVIGPDAWCFTKPDGFLTGNSCKRFMRESLADIASLKGDGQSSLGNLRQTFSSYV